MDRGGTLLFLLATLAVPLSACGRYAVLPSATTTTGRPAEIVPWLDRPVAPYTAPSPTPYPTTAAVCRTSQLRLGATQTGAGMSQAVLQVSLVNTGPAACLLQGTPRVTGITATGVRLNLPAQAGPTFAGGLVPADIAPGDHGYLDVGTGTACGSGQDQLKSTTYRQLTFVLPDGGELPSDLTFSAGSCGVIVDQLGLVEQAEAEPAPGPFAGLSVQMEAPLTVAAGAVLHYVVILSNNSAKAITLAPCPGYTEWASALMSGESNEPPAFAYQLNCDKVKAIPAGGSVRYAMQLSIPASAIVGVGKFGWQLNEPGGPAAGSGLRVVP